MALVFVTQWDSKTERKAIAGLLLAALALGCNSFDEPPSLQPGPQLVVPTDERTVTQAVVTPPPISGGTLLVTRDGLYAVASDPDRDRVSIISLESFEKLADIELEALDEPGRLAEDNQGRVHVALRRGGAVVSIDLESQKLVERRGVCGAPRGIAFDGATDSLYVACAEGRLARLKASGSGVEKSVDLGPDLRDVIVTEDQITVTKFRSAELLRLDKGGTLIEAASLPRIRTMVERLVQREAFTEFTHVEQTLGPSVAWRTLSVEGETFVVHQRGVEDEIELTEPTESGSAYGGGSFGCDPIVTTAVSAVDRSGAIRSSLPIGGSTLPVDIAVSQDRRLIAIANAGPADPQAPTPHTVFIGDGDERSGASGVAPTPFGLGNGLAVFTADESNFTANGAEGEEELVGPERCAIPSGAPIDGPVVAVAFNPTQTNQLIVQQREPARLVVLQGQPLQPIREIPLGGEPRLDTGHELFHRDSGGGLACASCHPEGREDGRVWDFAGLGPRRTQPLDVGLEGTAPFHWDGSLPGLDSLMAEVFVRRMGGVLQSPERLESLQSWLFARQALPPLRDSGQAAVARGKALFESSRTACTSCHSGSRFTNNSTVAVGTGDNTPLQVPSLVGIGYRAPYLHDGCAQTLAERFDPSCGGGDSHGSTEQLSEPELSDLVAFLETL